MYLSAFADPSLHPGVSGRLAEAAIGLIKTQTPDSSDDRTRWLMSVTGRSFWHDVSTVIAYRAASEGWTRHDCFEAQMQASLLSYTSHPHAKLCLPRYFPSSPKEILHNAPWNNWVPPSKRSKRFEHAKANKKIEPVMSRVRARLCRSVDEKGLQGGKIVFARVERNTDGKKLLQLLRGRDVLASMNLMSLRIERTDELAIALMPRTKSKRRCPVVFLAFEDTARLTKFVNMLL